ncbi:hypothetical protein EJ06DRAFT_551547 [Trichodelitschia bisporula]|uniref:DH domain-containing protein n=1 Tax=Trichodelitschia bisporula TaxID=703511 RepID=A0A6G1HKI5_9PEZI|nr:hypothetical protein EJ06DRAFT_551547 [Trichodelitschia bisporula]
MVVVVPPPPLLSPDIVSLFHVADDLLEGSPILVFYGPSVTPTAATSNTSRIQAHIFTPAGLVSYPRLTVSPNSPLYSAVNCLPREEQGDDICRGLAFSLYKYFSELPQTVRATWERELRTLPALAAAPPLFGDAHAAMLASRMVRVENVAEVARDVRQALAEQTVSWLDLDLVLPEGAVRVPDFSGRDSILPDPSEEDATRLRFGEFAPVVRLFGDLGFLPTARLRRAPSRPNSMVHNAVFTRKQKETIRREMCELLDTEESYVAKLDELVNGVATDFRSGAKNRTSNTSPGEADLTRLFPDTLDQILETNAAFLEDLRKVVEETENDAIQDIEATSDHGTIMPAVPSRTDVTGTLALGTCLRAWLPKFGDCYLDYMRAHAHFPKYMRSYTAAKSSFSKRVQDTGEQRLMSMLIEPIQRLPRYNLYIDSIIKQLPERHPALKSLLKVRDTISEICSSDAGDAQPSRINDKLRKHIAGWPSSFRSYGRLVTAIDVAEIPPPYRPDPNSATATPGIMLLFTENIVLLTKSHRTGLTARGLLSRLDGTDVIDKEDAPPAQELRFNYSLDLHSFEFTEVDGGKMIQLAPTHNPTFQQRPGSAMSLTRPTSRAMSRPASRAGDNDVQVYYLTGAYEGKAAKVVEEVVRARTENRFPEQERESPEWEVRLAHGPDLNLFTAVYQDGPAPEGRGKPAKVRVVIGKADSAPAVRDEGVEVVVYVSATREGLYLLEIEGGKEVSRDRLTVQEFLPVLVKRLGNILQMRSQIRNPAIATTLLLRNQLVLTNLKITTEEQMDPQTKDRVTAAQRPHSPVKMLSNLFGGSITRDHGSFRKPPLTHTISGPSGLGNIPHLQPSSRPTSQEGQASQEGPARSPSMLVKTTRAAADVLEKLEESLSSYVLALHARRGNIVGKVLRNRTATAEELAVNELYNKLLEDPANMELVANAPVDVLFCAFEQFLKIAWCDKMGPVISVAAWSAILAKLDALYPSDFEEFFRMRIAELAPQNQRALKSIIKLLVSLLEGTGNDGDRGMLTASFAEILVPDGNPLDFIPVLDRLVEDSTTLLDNPRPTPSGSLSGPPTRTTNSASLTSNTSSLRRKFGLGLSRKGSKHADEDLSSSVWRTLSKSKHESPTPSLSKKPSHLVRASSTDSPRAPSPKRPSSRDRPTVLGGAPFDPVPNLGLSTIGEHPTAGPPRKKRRSSLSDLLTLQAAGNQFGTPVRNSPRPSPRTPKQSFIPTPTPTTPLSHSFLRNASTPTGTGAGAQATPTRALPRPVSQSKPKDEVTITARRPVPRHTATTSASGIPQLRPAGLVDRAGAGNVRRLPGSRDGEKVREKVKEEIDPALAVAPLKVGGGRKEGPATGAGAGAGSGPGTPAGVGAVSAGASTGTSDPSARLRMVGPAKLRERVTAAKTETAASAGALAEEMARIGAELSTLSRASPPRGQSHSLATLSARLSALETRHTALMSEVEAKLDGLARDVNETLMVSEARCRKLDGLLRDAGAENEGLYARFNEEMARVTARVRGGEGVEEMRRRVREGEDEGSRLRKENARLRREVGGLRAQLRPGV